MGAGPVFRARHGWLRPQRLTRGTAPFLRSGPALRSDRGAQGVGRRRQNRRADGNPRHAILRHRSGKTQPPVGLGENIVATPIEVLVPDIGGFKDVSVIEVLVKDGQQIDKEAPMITIETEKAAMDVPSPAAGRVAQVKLKRGDKVSEGSLILL